MITKRKERSSTGLILATLRSTTPIKYMRFRPLLTLFIFVTTVFIACKKEENFTSRVTFVNASISNPSITIKADSFPFISNVRYDSLVINNIVPSGTLGINLFNGSIFQSSFTTGLESGGMYTSLVYDSASSKKFYMRKDALPATPGDGQCSVRFFNTVFNTSGLFIANDTAKGVIFTQSFANFLTSNTFSTIDTIKRATIRIDSSLRAIDTFPQPLRSGKIYHIYFIGKIQDTLPNGVRKPKVIIQALN